MKTQELRTHELYLRLVLLSVKHAAWLLVKVAASEGERVELSLLPKFTTDEPVNAAETSPTDRHHRLLRGPRLRLPCSLPALPGVCAYVCAGHGRIAMTLLSRSMVQNSFKTRKYSPLN